MLNYIMLCHCILKEKKNYSFFTSRYQSIRRTITSRAHEDNATSSTPASTSTTVPSSSSPENQRVLLLRSPAVRFLTRPDFLNVLHMNDVSINYVSPPHFKVHKI